MSDELTPRGARGVWTEAEHERFRSALELFPRGPWKQIAAVVGTRTVRQVQTHAQKYEERAARRLRQLCQTQDRSPHPVARVTQEVRAICDALHYQRVPLSPRATARARQSEPTETGPEQRQRTV